jgi:Ig-like domain-containing protein
MYKPFQHVFAIITGLAVAAGGNAYAQDAELLDIQPEFPKIVRQPEDQAIRVGSNVTFTVTAQNGDSYQWTRNGVELKGETNSTLTLVNVAAGDVGLYSCCVIKGDEAVPTRAANLNVVMSLGGGSITVFGTPIVSTGGTGTCPGPYAGYVLYSKTLPQGWGWVPSVGSTIHTATDLNRTDTKIQAIGKWGDVWCNQTSVLVPHLPFSPKYRYAVFFPDNVPTNAYAITLDGFDP